MDDRLTPDKAESHCGRARPQSILRNGLCENGGARSTSMSLDATDILHASLEFEDSFATPGPQPLDFRRSSSSSLYPSIDRLSDSENQVDVERNWEAASVSSLKRRANNGYQKQSNGVLTMGANGTARTLSFAEEDAVHATAAATSIPPAAVGSAVAARPAMTAAAAPSDDMIAMKLAAYGEGNTTSIAASVATLCQEDEEMHAMKMAAYGGQSAAGPTARMKEASVEPTEYVATPTFDAVQAEIVDYDFCAQSTNEVSGYLASPTVVHSTDAMGTDAVVDVTDVTATDGETAEATVIESGPMEKATPEAWSAAPAAEATVLQEDSVRRVSDLDTKPPARSASWEDQRAFSAQPIDANVDQQAVATIVEYDVHPSDLSTHAVQAEFVGQDYTATLDNGAQDSTAIVDNTAIAATDATYSVEGAQVEEDEEEVTEVAVIESGPMEKATAEAWSAAPAEEAQVLEQTTTVAAPTFESKPPPPGPSETWERDSDVHGFAMADGEAEVVGITESVHPSEFVDNAGMSAEAELIGSDFNTAVAVPSNDSEASGVAVNDVVVEEAEIIVEDGQDANYRVAPVSADEALGEPQEAHATLVEAPNTEVSQEVSAVTAVLQESTPQTGRSVSEPQPATPVTTILVETETTPPSVSFSDPVKPQPFSGRISSAPPTTGTLSEDLSNMTSSRANEPNWSRVEPMDGNDPSLPPIPPPTLTPTQVRGLEHGQTLPPPIPSPRPVAPTVSTASRSSRGSNKSSTSTSSECAGGGLQVLSSNIARGANNMMESLFGNNKSGPRRTNLPGLDLENMSGSVLPRTLLPSSVIFSEATSSWVATVNTNQKALEANNVEESSKALKAFSVPTKKQAMALARAWAPPMMHPFGSNPSCFVCETNFTVFRRASHCKNCGVCICASCSVQWPSKMLPATYNIKKTNSVSICKACDWLCSAFRKALLDGNRDQAVALHSTGNINLTTPFANVKGELFYPVHCAVLGGNASLLKWLVDEHCCPLRSIRISNGRQKDSAGSYTPILTSKGRSLLGIALGNRNIGIVRYLVVEKRMLLSAEKGLSVETLAQNLDLVLRVLPEEVLSEQAFGQTERKSSGGGDTSTRATSVTFTDSAHGHGDDIGISTINIGAMDDDVSATHSSHDECIICFDNPIDCVMTPCGHQICCLTCGNNISRCPVCAVECTPMRVFKP